ncbi:MAG: universal stress protein [Acidobacteria bacterium]|nr:universal stress protein [Acidobacteriota bacterium]
MSRKRKSREFSKILVATDFSRGAEYALDRAVRLPLARGATLHLLHVLPEGMPRKIRGQTEAGAWRRLKQAASIASKTAKRTGNTELVVVPEIVTGTTYVEIIGMPARWPLTSSSSDAMGSD